jgi:hypothetical protein
VKTRKLTVSYIPDPSKKDDPHSGTYVVLKIVDSTEYAPDQILSTRTVDDLCRDRRWNVTILPRKVA